MLGARQSYSIASTGPTMPVPGGTDQRGSSPRENKNTLVFLAADRTRLGQLDQAARQYLAWKSIEAGRETLNLDAFQSNLTKTKPEQAEETVNLRQFPDQPAGLEACTTTLPTSAPPALRRA